MLLTTRAPDVRVVLTPPERLWRWAIIPMLLCCGAIAAEDGGAIHSVAPDDTAHHDRMGGEDNLQAQLSAHLSGLKAGEDSARVAYRRKMHEAHIAAHQLVDPDIEPDASTEVRHRFQESRRRLMEQHAFGRGVAGSITPLKAALLFLIFSLPIIVLAIWVKC